MPAPTPKKSTSPPETITCVHCHRQTPMSRPFRAPEFLYVILWRTKNGSAHPRKPIVIVGDDVVALKEYQRYRRERTKLGAIPVLTEYTLTEDGLARDDGAAVSAE